MVRRLLESPLDVESVLGTETRLAALADTLARRDCPVFAASQAVLDRVAGFHVHRGCLAVGRRPAADLALPAGARTIWCSRISSMSRTWAHRSATRRRSPPTRGPEPALRRSVLSQGDPGRDGHDLALPIVRCAAWPDDLLGLKRAHGFALWGAVLDERAARLTDVARPPRVAILLGTEGPGLSPAARATCDGLFTIPMAPAADSLNVATAGAIALYHFQQAARSG